MKIVKIILLITTIITILSLMIMVAYPYDITFIEAFIGMLYYCIISTIMGGIIVIFCNSFMWLIDSLDI